MHGQGGQPEQRGDAQGDRKDRVGGAGCGVAEPLPEARRRQVDDRRAGPDLVLALQRGVQVPQQQERRPPRSIAAAAAAASRRWPAIPWRSRTAAYPAISTSSDRSANSPNGCADTSIRADRAYGTTQRAPARPHQDQHEPGAEVGARDHGRVAAGELAEVDRDRRGRGHDRHHGAPGAAEQLAPEAVADGDGDDAEQRRGQPQPEDVVPPQEDGVHQQIVQRRAVAVVDRDAQHVQGRCPGRDAQRDALVVVQRAEIEAEPDHHARRRRGWRRAPPGAATGPGESGRHGRESASARHYPPPAAADRCAPAGGSWRTSPAYTGEPNRYPLAHGI